MANNSILRNAAISGALGGMIAGTGGVLTGAQVTSYTAAAVAFADDVDTAIANNALISVAGGAVNVPATDDEQCDELAAVTIMTALCYAAWQGKGNPGATSAGAQATLVASVAAAWTAAFAARTTP